MYQLEKARTEVLKKLDSLENELKIIYTNYPGLFPKDPGGMSVSDKLRFSGDLINFLEVRDQYKSEDE